MSSPYSISLLNDLHHHFPDLLYQPQRFRNVADVLNYIIQVANQNPYERERQAYEQRREPTVPSASSSSSSSAPSSSSSSSRQSSTLNNSDALYRIIHGASLPVENEILFTASAPSRSRAPTVLGRSMLSNNDNLISNVIGSLFGSGSNLQTFLDQTVPIRPSSDVIYYMTTLTSAPRQMSDNCAICQDPIEEGQQMRILNYCTHSFHATCIDTWFESHVTCPTCRHDIRNNNG